MIGAAALAARAENMIGPLDPLQRRARAVRLRQQSATELRRRPFVPQTANADEFDIPNFAAVYTKCLPHDENGEVLSQAYYAYLSAINEGTRTAIDAIPMGGTLRLGNPMACFGFEMEGNDSHDFACPPAPSFSSAEMAAEVGELYWLALTRDVPFREYDSSPLIAQAAQDLSKFSDFRAPKLNGLVTADTIFRGPTSGDLTGPYISQFLWLAIPYGGTRVPQLNRTAAPGRDHLTDYAAALKLQNGGGPTTAATFDDTPRYIRNGRDLAEWAHIDFSFELGLNAGLILLSFGTVALSDTNPYRGPGTQSGSITFGGPHMIDVTSGLASPALRATWVQKWLVHRRVRPEAFAIRVQHQLTGRRSYRIHQDLLQSEAVNATVQKYGAYLLPMAYPEGSPTHPSYPAGHAAIAGACVTILKAFFREDFVVPAPVVASADGLTLETYIGPPLTVGGELNKLAANVALGRDTAGVHYRSDGIQGLQLGEQVAIEVLSDHVNSLPEVFDGFQLTRFDGTRINIKGR